MAPDGKTTKVTAHTLWIDFMLKVKNLPGDEIDFGKIRELVLYLRRDLRFRLRYVSGDQFTWPLLQELRKHDFEEVEQTSVDIDMDAYLLTKELHLENRIDFYEYGPYITEITTIKRVRLQRAGALRVREKCDHPMGGSKDVSDAVAGMAAHAFNTEGSEFMPVAVVDPSVLRREMPKPVEIEERMVIPANYGKNPLEKFFKPG
jgi:hypothetical protein